MRRTAGAALLLLVMAARPAEALRLPLRSYGPPEGLTDPGVNRVRVGPDGFVWVATLGGLWRFDGERFEALGPPDGLPRREVFDLAFARDGSLWIASEAGLFHGDPARVEPGRPTFSELPLGSGASKEIPHRLACALDGTVWVGTFRGLWRVAPRAAGTHAEGVALDVSGSARSGSRVQALAVGSDGSVWVGTHADGVYRLRRDGRIEHRPSEAPGCNFVRAFLLEDDGSVWTAYFGGVARFDAARFGTAAAPDPVLGPAEGLPGIDTKTLLAWGPGQVLLASTAGLTEIDRDAGGAWHAAGTLDRRSGLPDDDVGALERDAAGNLWIGLSQRGLVKRIAAPFVEEDEVEEPGARIAALGRDRDGRLAVLSKTGATAWTLRILGPRGVEVRHLAPPSGLSYVGWGLEQLLAQEADGAWWVASGIGLLHYPPPRGAAPGTERAPDAVLGTGEGLPGPDVYLLYLDAAGDVWVSAYPTRPGLSSVARVRHGSRRADTFAPGAVGSASLAVGFAQDAGGNLWIAFEDGTLVRRRGGTFQRVAQPIGGLSAAPFVLDARGRLWVLGDGLAVVDDPAADAPTARPYRLPPPLEETTFTSGVDDGAGVLYLGSLPGLVRLDPERERACLFTAADGLLGGVVRLATRDASGVLWFSDGSGLSRLTPAPDPPAVHHAARIRSVRIAGVPFSLPAVGAVAVGPLTVAPSARTVEVGWFAVHLGPGQPPRFEHRLEGAGSPWSAPSDARSVLYAGLAPGRYRFAVRAVEPDGTTVTQPAVVELRVLAPIWRRGWFVGLLGLAAAGALYSVHRLRVARAVAIERVRTRIATDLHDEIGSTLSQISVLSQVAERDAARAAGAAPPSLARIADLARGVVEAMGETVWAISPREERLSDLVHRMRRFALDLFADGTVEIRLDLPSDEADERLDPEARRTVWLVFKEALHNAQKHASAGAVAVQLRRETGGFTLAVQDDGRGFDPAVESAGHGLDSMRRRAEAIGGRLEVRAARGGPTALVLHVPRRRSNLFRRIVGGGADGA